MIKTLQSTTWEDEGGGRRDTAVVKVRGQGQLGRGGRHGCGLPGAFDVHVRNKEGEQASLEKNITINHKGGRWGRRRDTALVKTKGQGDCGNDGQRLGLLQDRGCPPLG